MWEVSLPLEWRLGLAWPGLAWLGPAGTPDASCRDVGVLFCLGYPPPVGSDGPDGAISNTRFKTCDKFTKAVQNCIVLQNAQDNFLLQNIRDKICVEGITYKSGTLPKSSNQFD